MVLELSKQAEVWVPVCVAMACSLPRCCVLEQPTAAAKRLEPAHCMREQRADAQGLYASTTTSSAAVAQHTAALLRVLLHVGHVVMPGWPASKQART